MLAVYERPKDFSTELEEKRLQVFEIDINDYKDLVNEIDVEVERFMKDLERIKNNPLLTENDFI